MKKRKKKLNIKKLILFLLFLFAAFYLSIKYLINNFEINLHNITIFSNYKVMKQDKNKNYTGIGQEKVKNQDGYFTIFTTEEKNQKTYKEYKQNGTASWSDNNYWGSTMSENGCGITVMAIILSGYHKNYTPEELRKKYYPVIDYEKLSNELSSTFGIQNSDFYYDSLHLSKKYLIEHLQTNRPIMICVWNKPNNNRWTTSSHYMVLLATDGNDMVYISNPNGLENDSKSSGWYDIEEITPYIAKALYIESY